MKTKKFDAIKMVRSIRDKSSRDYYSNKKRWLKELSELQGSEIIFFDNRDIHRDVKKSRRTKVN